MVFKHAVVGPIVKNGSFEKYILKKKKRLKREAAVIMLPLSSPQTSEKSLELRSRVLKVNSVTSLIRCRSSLVMTKAAHAAR